MCGVAATLLVRGRKALDDLAEAHLSGDGPGSIRREALARAITALPARGVDPCADHLGLALCAGYGS